MINKFQPNTPYIIYNVMNESLYWDSCQSCISGFKLGWIFALLPQLTVVTGEVN